MRIHFIGIGGIGVSALAQYYLQKGYEISGSDLAPSEITDFLKNKGVQILIGNQAEHIQESVDLVIYSPAVKPDNPEFLSAKNKGIKLQSYPEALGQLTREYTTIAISGSHGKSTTTAMTALALIAGGIDPTVIVGTKLKEFGNSNFRMGKSKYLVIEACEYDGSFLEYSPKIAVITNVDKEHIDYFKTFANVKKAFRDFAKKVPADGFLITEKNLPMKEAKNLKLQVPGQHNILNALSALSVARLLGVKDGISFKALSEFTGTWRRFEITKTEPYTVVSDYGHHPNEILATLTAAREKYPDKKIWVIFQPHQYQRTYYLLKDFIKVFRNLKIDNIIITDIYDVAGREEKNINQKINSELLVKKINKKQVQYMSLANAEKFVKKNIKSGEVLIIMGAGDIYKLVEKF
ncbi:MAG: UDP-N-acetylmuramate--L-alanine ligase [Candidatus Staskawiczbacteria bacterium]|nr:UDP-N-acetylmuramate--L-alanine ligase [Candidatus Staskawiczbacteria bacterium]